MAMPTVAAAAALHSSVASPSSTRRVGVGNGNSSAAAGAGFLAGGRRGGAAGAVRARVAEAAPVAAEANRKESPAAPMVEIPVTCYQILGITEKAEKDEIVKAAMELKNAEIEDGYTAEVSTCRQALLVDVRDKLLFEQEYAGSIKEKVPPRSSLHIPWSWLPAALCVLQEVGEEKLVLEIGQAALRHLDSKLYVHDVLLAMALAECSIAKASFEKSKVSLGFEALARAQYLLRRKPSLEKMPLLEQESGTTVFEKLQQLQSNGSSNSRNYGLTKKKDSNDKVTVNQSLELWLKDVVLSRFADTRDCSPSLANFFGAPKRILSTSKQKLGATRMVLLSSQPSSSASPCNRTSGEQTPRFNSTSHLGEAVKQLAPTNLGVHSSMDRPVNGSSTISVPLKRKPGSHPVRTLESWGLTGDIIGKLAYTALLGFALFGTLKLLRFQFGYTNSAPTTRESAATLSLNEASISEGSFITSSVRKHFEKLSKMLWLHNRLNLRSEESDLSPVANVVASTVCKQRMDLQEAETLVKQWQDIKSEALGPDYQIDMLPEILDGSMLSKWQDLALSAKDQSCYWRFVLLNLSVVRAEILLDEVGAGEVAEIDVVLEEAAELVDDLQPKKPSYYSTYEVQYILRRQNDGSWRICEAVVRDLT